MRGVVSQHEICVSARARQEQSLRHIIRFGVGPRGQRRCHLALLLQPPLEPDGPRQEGVARSLGGGGLLLAHRLELRVEIGPTLALSLTVDRDGNLSGDGNADRLLLENLGYPLGLASEQENKGLGGGKRALRKERERCKGRYVWIKSVGRRSAATERTFPRDLIFNAPP